MKHYHSVSVTVQTIRTAVRTQMYLLTYLLTYQGCGVGVGVSLLKKKTPTSGNICNFVAVYLTSVQCILQLKLCSYTIVHFLLEGRIKNFSQIILEFTIIMSHSKSSSWSQSSTEKRGLRIPVT